MEQKNAELPSQIGPFSIERSLGRGGMGEVFLAKDPAYSRSVALKRIRPELNANPIIQGRFLREANVASALNHPSIVPILSIQMGPPDIYYTMPYVEGETLRQILRRTREQEKNGEPLDPLGRSIPALSRIFLQVCQAVAYTHARGILHRDLKPENIIVGKYGEVMILDWGIADYIDKISEEEPIDSIAHAASASLTRPGKIAGTLAYMAPERLKGKSSSVQTDIYALGVILYQILTLQLPFQRKTMAAFKKSLGKEELIDPIEMAPYRDIPHQLAAVCNRCLSKNLAERQKSVEELIGEIKNYIEGRPEWVFLSLLDVKNKSDWQFQEHILLAKHIAITQSLDVTEWAELMISKRAYPDTLRLDAEVQMEAESFGLGILINVPEVDERKSLEEGYCIWLGSEKEPSCRLFRNNVLVMEAKDVYLQANVTCLIRIEKIEDHFKFFVQDKLVFSFGSPLPLAGAHIGLLHKDGKFQIKKLAIYGGSRSAQVNCLAVPNAFLSHRLYDHAFREYRRIGQSFPGRTEGREALFRAGLTLLEKGKSLSDEKYYHLALKEFEKLYHTPGAPLEYLGKSLVYQALVDEEEEAKCLELSLRKFPKHPLLPMLKEHIVYRIHESSLNNRESAYRIILLALRHIPDLLENPDTRTLLESLKKNWEPLLFIEQTQEELPAMAIQLAFWLNLVPILSEMVEALTKREHPREDLIANALFCLIELDALSEVEKYLSLPYKRIEKLNIALTPPSKITALPLRMGKCECRSIHYVCRKALANSEFDLFLKIVTKLRRCEMPSAERASLDALEAWSYLLQNKLSEASLVFGRHPLEMLQKETSPLHFAYGTWLYMTQGPKTASLHFASVLDTPYPPTTALPSHFLTGLIDDEKGWIEKAFWWEKKELHRQLDYFYRSVGRKK
jgi:serine/threonine-protein kinase